jgi:methyl-accepting chemotaxis protein
VCERNSDGAVATGLSQNATHNTHILTSHHTANNAMGLRLKFNLVLLAIFLAGFVTVGVIANRYLYAQSIEDAKRVANVVLDTSVIGSMDPRVSTSIGSRLIEMRVQEFAENQADTSIQKWVITHIKSSAGNSVADLFETPGHEQILVVARHLFGSDGSQARYRMVTINGNNVTATAHLALTTLMSSIGIVFVAVFFVLNIMLDRMIVRPVSEMAREADAVSIGDFSVAEFKPTSKDEIGMLGVAFNRMRRSTEEAIKLLKGS